MSDFRDWQITLPFSVPVGDVDGVLTEALLDAALEHAPAQAAGMVARADTHEGRVWITFTLVDTSKDLADSISAEMLQRVRDAVLSGDDACVSAA